MPMTSRDPIGPLGRHAAAATHSLHWLRNRSLPVLVAVVLLLATYPFFDTPGQPTPISAMLLFGAVPLLGVLMLSTGRWIVVALILAMSANVATALFYDAHFERALGEWPGMLIMAFYVAATLVIARAVFFGASMLDDRVYGGVAVYLLIGIIFAIIHHRLGVESPSAYLVSDQAQRGPQLNWADYLYYSFVCLTTVGFGDISPRSVWARNVSVAEAAVGMLYPAVLLARLVSRSDVPQARR